MSDTVGSNTPWHNLTPREKKRLAAQIVVFASQPPRRSSSSRSASQFSEHVWPDSERDKSEQEFIKAAINVAKGKNPDKYLTLLQQYADQDQFKDLVDAAVWDFCNSLPTSSKLGEEPARKEPPDRDKYRKMGSDDNRKLNRKLLYSDPGRFEYYDDGSLRIIDQDILDAIEKWYPIYQVEKELNRQNGTGQVVDGRGC